MGRKRLFKNNAEKLRVWRARKKIKNNLGVYMHTRLDIETRKALEITSPELMKENLRQEQIEEDLEENLDKMSEEEFKEYVRNSHEHNDAWFCSCNDIENFIYKERCSWCGIPRPDDRDDDSEKFLNKYPMAKKWSKVEKLGKDIYALWQKGYLDGSISI
jgi:biotin synthase-like enzyme